MSHDHVKDTTGPHEEVYLGDQQDGQGEVGLEFLPPGEKGVPRALGKDTRRRRKVY